MIRLSLLQLVKVKGSFFIEPTIQIYLGPEKKITDELYSCNIQSALTNHHVPQNMSGNTGNSQEKDYEHHMVHPTRWWTQVTAGQDLLVTGSAASGVTSFDLERLTQPSMTNEIPISLLDVDMDTTPDGDGSPGLVEHGEIKKANPELVHTRLPLFRAFCQDDFLDLLSDELWSEETDMDDRGLLSRSDRLGCIADEGIDMMTDLSVAQSAEALVLGDENYLHAVKSGPSNDGATLHAGKEDVEKEMRFVELVT